MGFLQFGLLCIDFLAWPMLALAYPLCASIRAIETGSKYHMRKLVTYWTVLSIVSLFEHTLRVMEWVPLWPYVKLVGTFWLVVPRFNGACYAYDCLVNADLGAKLHFILSQISHAFFAHKHLSIDIKAIEQTTEQVTEETKSKEFKAVETTTEQGIPEERKVKSADDNIGQMQKRETESPWVKGIPVEEKIIPGINSSKLIQREWTCAVCQVTTTSENNLKSHLGGMRHRTNIAELKPIKRATKLPGSPSPKATNQPKTEPLNHAPIEAKSKHKTGTASESADPRLYCRICNIWCSREADMASHLKGRKHSSNLNQTGIMTGNEPPERGSKHETIVKPDPRLYCNICNIWCSREADLASHLNGRKHLSNVKPEKATGLPYQVKNEAARPNAPKQEKVPVSTDYKLYCSLCNIWAPCEAGLLDHFMGKKHLSKLKEIE